MIFLSITGAFTTAVIYDKREKNRAQRRWMKAVEHIGKEPLPPGSMPRKLCIFLEAPPSDGLRIAQDHFKDYVKPILVASGLDWEFIQGRKEGDVRAEIAERIRNSRLPPDQRREEDIVTETRRKSGVPEFDGIRGDIVIGRHTWKEYVRGVHEGWLGPLTEPPKAEQKSIEEVGMEDKEKAGEAAVETLPGITITSTPKEADEVTSPSDADSKPFEKPKKPPQPPPFITTAEYSNASPADLPTEFDPSQPISFPHILGFLNTPRRLYRFLNRRHVADSIGRETAAAILATYRPYHTTSTSSADPGFSTDTDQSPQTSTPSTPQTAEQQTVLIEEEKEWHKSVRVVKDDDPERTWLDPVVLDPRIASRMRRFEVTPEEEARVKAIVVPEEEVEGWIKGGIRTLAREGLKAVGFKKDKKPTPTEGEEEVLE